MRTVPTIPNIISSVSELTNEIKDLLESNFVDVMVSGEVSMPKQSANGHVYFTLKDDKAQMPCVMWRSAVQSSGGVPKHGDQIVCGGQIQLYAPHGRYQMIVSFVQASGAGALQAKFEALKAKLQSEGLFDPAIKKSLPRYPNRIGVVTSKSSAAFQDICQTIEKRWPLAAVVLVHAATQGATAKVEIAKGIRMIQDSGDCDVLIVGRGGGSLEDLWPFNEEIVARSIFACPIPVISAVGHETDFTISDFVADVRAATPTQAAVLATPDQNDILLAIEDMSSRTRTTLVKKYQEKANRLNFLKNTHGLKRVPENIEKTLDQLQFLRQKMKLNIDRSLSKRRESLNALTHKIELINPNAPLELGYTRIIQDKKWVKKSADLDAKTPVEIRWKDGSVTVSK